MRGYALKGIAITTRKCINEHMDALTSRQQQILDLIRERIDREGMPPTRAEIARTLGFRSANAAEQHLRALARKGAITLMPGASRGIRLPRNDADTPEDGLIELPVIGRVAAGSPVLAAEHVESHVRLDPAMFQPRADYFLRVRGMSMRDAGIFDDDLVAVHRTPDIREGQIVVARLHDEVTVKRLSWDDADVLLKPENPDFEPIRVSAGDEEFIIEGRVVGVIRRGGQ